MFTGIFCVHGNGCSGLNVRAKFHCLMYILLVLLLITNCTVMAY